jgi:8-oxo-dGTP diphosphatase
MKTILIVQAIIRRGDHVLLVEQQGPNDAVPNWALPGGRVEAGEPLTAALAREVREETGLAVKSIGPLAFVTQVLNPAHHGQVLAFAYEVLDWDGAVAIDDPDGLILSAHFLPIDEVITTLAAHEYRYMGEPAADYLRHETPATTFTFRKDADGRITRLE